MKKSIAILLILLLALGLATGCGGNDNPVQPAGDDNPAENAGQSNTDAVQPAENTPASGEEVEESDVAGLADAGENLAAAYIDMLSGGAYYMKYRTETDMGNQKIEAITEMAINGVDMAIKTKVADIESIIIFKDDHTYMVDHTDKTVVVTQGGIFSLNESKLPKSGYVLKGSGSAEFFGAMKKYEDYSAATENVRFFFEGGKLIGVESVQEGLATQMEILELSGKIPSGMFDIPEDYDTAYTQI
jgi:cytochrome oxidase Cu insertion factor (SCO1/SenC/PrrC family)